jgi:hypothetical protein
MRALLLLLMFKSIVADEDTLLSFRSTLDWSDNNSVGGATLTEPSSAEVDPNENVEEFTLCFRFKLKVLGGAGQARRLIYIGDWEVKF